MPCEVAINVFWVKLLFMGLNCKPNSPNPLFVISLWNSILLEKVHELVYPTVLEYPPMLIPFVPLE